MISLQTVVENFMDVLNTAVGETFGFHSNYTSDVELPSITVKVMPGQTDILTTDMSDFHYNVVLTLRQDEKTGQDERQMQANQCYSDVVKAFGNGFKIEEIMAVCNGFKMGYAGENNDVPQIEFDFDYMDISHEVESPEGTGRLDLEINRKE